MKSKHTILRGIVWMICLYHLILGITLNCPVDTISWVAKNTLGATKMPDASALFLARMLGTYLILFGIGMGMAAWNPIKNRGILTLGAILVVLRTVQRLMQVEDLQSALGITSRSNWTTVVVLVGFAAVLAFFRYRIYQDMTASEKTEE